MLKKLIIANKPQTVNWTPSSVCKLLECGLVRAEQLIQPTKNNTHKLIRDLYLLACQAALKAPMIKSKEAELLRSYARTIKQISEEYDHLFRRQTMIEAEPQYESTKEKANDSSINNIDRMQARLFYLTTQFSVHPCTHLAGHIVDLLTSLCKHPHIELLPAQPSIYSQSMN